MGNGRNQKFKNYRQHRQHPSPNQYSQSYSKEARLIEQQNLYSQLWPNYLPSDQLKSYKIPRIDPSKIGNSSYEQKSVLPASSTPTRFETSKHSRHYKDFGFGFGSGYPLINRVTGSSYQLNDDFSHRSAHSSASTSSPSQISRSRWAGSEDSQYESETWGVFVDPDVTFPDDDDLDIIEIFVREDLSWLDKGPATN